MATNGLTAAKGLARSVESAGGLMRISVPALGDAFGRGKLTTRAKTGIEQVLAKAGVTVEPSLTDPANDGWVTLRIAKDAPAPIVPPEVEPHASAAQRPARLIVGVLAFLVPGLLVLALASPDANRPGRAAAETTTPTVQEQADDALLAGDYTKAVRLTRQADPAKVPALRRRIAAALVTQARSAQRRKAYVKAIKLSRRAARYGRAPGASQIIRQSRAGLDLRRQQQRQAAGG
jgi:hypothetical protein